MKRFRYLCMMATLLLLVPHEARGQADGFRTFAAAEGDSLRLTREGCVLCGDSIVGRLDSIEAGLWPFVWEGSLFAGDIDGDGLRDYCVGWNEEGVGRTRIYLSGGQRRTRTLSASLYQLLLTDEGLAAITIQAGLYSLVRFLPRRMLWVRSLPLYFNGAAAQPDKFFMADGFLCFRDKSGRTWYNRRGRKQYLRDER